MGQAVVACLFAQVLADVFQGFKNIAAGALSISTSRYFHAFHDEAGRCRPRLQVQDQNRSMGNAITLAAPLITASAWPGTRVRICSA